MRRPPGSSDLFFSPEHYDQAWVAYRDQLVAWAGALGVAPIAVDVPPRARPRFRARLRLTAGEEGCALVDGSTNGAVNQQGAAGHPSESADVVLIGGLRRGSLEVEVGRERFIKLRPGDLFATDYCRPMRMRWSPHNVFFLVLPRKALETMVGLREVPPSQGFHVLPRGGLAALLRLHLMQLARPDSLLEPGESASAIAAARDMAATVLRRIAQQRTANSDEGGLGLLAAAQRYVDRHYQRHNIGVADVARAVGCSRTHLYRVFAAHGVTVGGYIRETRLRRARERLGAQGNESAIAAIAFDCGYTDPSAFGKAFRRRFDMSPRDWQVLQKAPDANRL